MRQFTFSHTRSSQFRLPTLQELRSPVLCWAGILTSSRPSLHSHLPRTAAAPAWGRWPPVSPNSCPRPSASLDCSHRARDTKSVLLGWRTPVWP